MRRTLLTNHSPRPASRTLGLTYLTSVLWAAPLLAQAPAAAPATAPPPASVADPAVAPAAVAATAPPSERAQVAGSETGKDEVRAHFAPLINRPGGLTSKQAAAAAAKQSPTAKAAQSKIDSAQAQIDAVTWRYLPTLSVSASYTHLSPQPQAASNTQPFNIVVSDQPGQVTDLANLFAFDGTSAFVQQVNQFSLNAGLTVPLSDYLLNMSKATRGAKTGKRAAELNEKAERVNSAGNARLAYYDWSSAKLTAEETGKSVERAHKQKETLEAQLATGRAARADVLRADAFLANTELDQKRAESAEVIARERLNVLMTGGERSQPTWEIGEDLLTEEDVDSTFPQSIEDLQREALATRLELKSMRSTAAALMERAGVERSNVYPRLDAFANATYANPNPRIIPQVAEWAGSWDVGARLSWTLNSIGTQGNQAKQSEANAREFLAQAEGMEQSLRGEVLSAYHLYREATLATGTARRGVAAAEVAYRDRVILFENGRATSLDLLEAESALVDSRVALVRTYVLVRSSRVRLEHALGRDIKEIYPSEGKGREK
jgi:outer membrane protein TolC